MFGIVSFLDQVHDKIVNELWREMVADCTVINKHVPPLPHFSWRVFERCDDYQLDQILGEIATNTAPFKVRTSGLGIFTGEQLVVYVSLVKDEVLLNFQSKICQRTNVVTKETSPFYEPDSWMPHITIINGKNSDQDIICALDKLIKLDLKWEFMVDSIALIGGFENDIGRSQHVHKFSSSRSQLDFLSDY